MLDVLSGAGLRAVDRDLDPVGADQLTHLIGQMRVDRRRELWLLDFDGSMLEIAVRWDVLPGRA